MPAKTEFSFNCPNFTVMTENSDTKVICPHFSMRSGGVHIQFEELSITLPKTENHSRSASRDLAQLKQLEQFYDVMRMFISQQVAKAEKEEKRNSMPTPFPVPVPVPNPDSGEAGVYRY